MIEISAAQIDNLILYYINIEDKIYYYSFNNLIY